MKVYRVEEIEDNTVRTTQVIEEFTPFQAAMRATGREVTLRKDEPNWIRVTEMLTRARQTRDGRVFEYRVGHYPAHG
jgi:ribosomal protein S16